MNDVFKLIKFSKPFVREDFIFVALPFLKRSCSQGSLSLLKFATMVNIITAVVMKIGRMIAHIIKKQQH